MAQTSNITTRPFNSARLEQTQNAYLVTTDIDKAGKENEKLLERVVRDFDDVPIEDRRKGKTVGELAKGHVYEIRNIGIGQPAPELRSIDLDGNAVTKIVRCTSTARVLPLGFGW